MFNFDSLNKRSTVMDGVNTQDMEFKKLKDFCGQKIECKGFFFTDGKYGKQVIVVGNGHLINMPARAVEQFEYIANNNDALNTLLNGKLLLTDIHEINTKNGDTIAYTLKNA